MNRSEGLVFRHGLRRGDIPRIRDILDRSGFFSREEIDVAAELAEDHLSRGAGSEYRFLVAEGISGTGGDELPVLVAFSCYGRIPLTACSFDLYWIAVDPACQGRGYGRAVLRRTEAAIRDLGGLRVYAETSSRAQYAPTRAFYQASGFARLAFFEDFYAQGDGKIIYGKIIP